MVNTFLLFSDYRKSANKLDRARLGKQRVEAYQILNLIFDLKTLSKQYKSDIPEDKSKWKSWIKEIAGKYKKKNYKFVVSGNKVRKVDKNTIKADINENERLMTLGFVYHPAVRMWLGWPEALKMYISAHIDEWEERGYVNTMRRYEISVDVVHPPWVYDSDIHKNHYSSLLNKEKERNEKPWYIKMDLYQVPIFDDYIWPV